MNLELLQRAEMGLDSVEGRVVVQAGIHRPRTQSKRADQLAEDESLKLVQRVFLQEGENTPRVVVFAAMDSGGGCSHVCASAAETLARNSPGLVCLMDANMRSPRLSAFFGVENDHGLTDALREQDSVTNYARRLHPDNLWLLSCGSEPKSSALLDSNRLKSRIEELRSTFDFLLIDAPPLNRYSEALMLAQFGEGLVLVLEADATRREAAVSIVENLRASEVRILGAVLNKRKFPIPAPLYSRL